MGDNMAITSKEIETKALAADMLEQDAYKNYSPQGTFTKDGLNKLISSINELMTIFKGKPIQLATVDAEQLPPDVTKALLMFNKAFKDSGLNEYECDIEGLTTDSDLLYTAGKLKSASKDKAFKTFLAKPQDVEDENETETETEVEINIQPQGESEESDVEEEDMTKLFMSRM